MAMIAKRRDICLVLDNIRSVHNVGSIFRTAETLGISCIYCIGTTPTPHDRFGRPRADFSKVALGAEVLPWEHVARAAPLMKRLKERGVLVVALEQSKKSVDYKSTDVVRSLLRASLSKGVAVILGNEVAGVSPALLKASDVVADIPMKGKKESLNVSVAAGVALFRWFDR